MPAEGLAKELAPRPLGARRPEISFEVVAELGTNRWRDAPGVRGSLLDRKAPRSAHGVGSWHSPISAGFYGKLYSATLVTDDLQNTPLGDARITPQTLESAVAEPIVDQ